jgi:hypothetical protein
MGISKKTKPDAAFGADAMIAAMMAVNPVAAKVWPNIMSESARFLTDRLQQDLDTQKALLACKSPTELMQVQAEFFRSAMEQYTDYATRLYTRMSTTAKDPDKGAGSGQSRSYDDVPL